MADLTKVLDHLDKALAEVKRAEAAMTPIEQIKQGEAYALGFLKSSILQLEECKNAVMQVAASRTKARAKTEPELPKGP